MAWIWRRGDGAGLGRLVTPEAATWLRVPDEFVPETPERRGEDRQGLLRGLYEVLADRDIRHVPEQFDPGRELQSVRTPREVLAAPGEGTCLDLAALWCGACAGYGLLPILIVLEDHVLVAVSLSHELESWDADDRPERELFADGPLTDEEALCRLVDGGRYVVVECTGFAAAESSADVPRAGVRGSDGRLPFDGALWVGREQLEERSGTLRFALDVGTAHHGEAAETPPAWLVHGERSTDGHRIVLGDPRGVLVEVRDAPPEITPRHPDRPPAQDLLVDRHEELEAASAITAGSSVGVSGPAGVGKTALLRWLCTRLHMDGRRAVHLEAGTRSPPEIVQDLFEQLFETDRPYQASRQRLAELLADRAPLEVVVDGPGLSRDALAELIEMVPGGVAWGASGPPRGDVTRVLPLGGLPEEDALELLERRLGRRLREPERPAALTLVRAVDGNPRTLLRAAAQVAAGASSFPTLVEGLGPGGDLTATVVAGLDEEERRLLDVLAAVGPATLGRAHVAEIAGVPEERAAAHLDGLERLHLAESHSPRHAVPAALAAWLGAHADLDPVRERALDHLEGWARSHDGDPGPLVAEADACLALARWGVESRRPEPALRLAQVLEGALAAGGRWEAWEELLYVAGDAGYMLDEPGVEAWTLHQLGSRALCMQRPEEARRHLRRARDRRRELGDELGAAVTANNLAVLSGSPATTDQEHTAAVAAVGGLDEGDGTDGDATPGDPTPGDTADTGVGEGGGGPDADDTRDDGSAGEDDAADGGGEVGDRAAMAGVASATTSGSASASDVGSARVQVASGEAPTAPVDGRAEAPDVEVRGMDVDGDAAVTTASDHTGEGAGSRDRPAAAEPSPRRRRPSLRTALLALGGVLAVVLALLLAVRSGSSLAVEPGQVDFAAVTIGDTARRSLTVENTTGGEVAVEAPRLTGADAFSLGEETCGGRRLEAAGTCTVEVVYRPSGEAGDAATLSLPHTGGELSVPLTGRGTAAPTPLPTVDPDPVRLGEVPVGTRATSRVTVRNEGGAPLAVGGIAARPGVFTVPDEGCTDQPVEPGGQCQLTVAFRPTGPGAVTGSLTVRHEGGTMQAAVSGRGVAGQVTLAPVTVGFDRVVVGETASRAVRLTNGGDAPVSVGEVGLDETSAYAVSADGCSGESVAPGASCRVTVGFTPPAGGEHTATLTVPHDGSGPTEVAVSGTGEPGAEPAQPREDASPQEQVPADAGSSDGASTSRLRFGELRVGADEEGTVTLSNTGDGPLSVGQARLGSTEAYSLTGDTCSGTTLPAGRSCRITVRFSPPRVGRHATDLTIPHGDAGATTIRVSGRGVASATHRVAVVSVAPGGNRFEGGSPAPGGGAYRYDGNDAFDGPGVSTLAQFEGLLTGRDDGAQDVLRVTYAPGGASTFRVVTDRVPAPPRVGAQAEGSTVTVDWDASAQRDAVYEIFRDDGDGQFDSGDTRVEGPVDGSPQTLTDEPAGTRVYFVRAVGGTSGAASPAVGSERVTVRGGPTAQSPDEPPGQIRRSLPPGRDRVTRPD